MIWFVCLLSLPLYAVTDFGQIISQQNVSLLVQNKAEYLQLPAKQKEIYVQQLTDTLTATYNQFKTAEDSQTFIRAYIGKVALMSSAILGGFVIPGILLNADEVTTLKAIGIGTLVFFSTGLAGLGIYLNITNSTASSQFSRALLLRELLAHWTKK